VYTLMAAGFEHGIDLFLGGRVSALAPGRGQSSRLSQVAMAVAAHEYVKAECKAPAPGQFAIEGERYFRGHFPAPQHSPVSS